MHFQITHLSISSATGWALELFPPSAMIFRVFRLIKLLLVRSMARGAREPLRRYASVMHIRGNIS